MCENPKKKLYARIQTKMNGNECMDCKIFFAFCFMSLLPILKKYIKDIKEIINLYIKSQKQNNFISA